MQQNKETCNLIQKVLTSDIITRKLTSVNTFAQSDTDYYDTVIKLQKMNKGLVLRTTKKQNTFV